MLLPQRLRAALAEIAEGRGRGDLARRAQAISAGYRARRSSDHSLTSEDDALAYALTRMPATFAAAAEALERLAEAAPEFAPRSLLDAGCGPGTASFAAAEVFPSLAEAALHDRNGPLLRLAGKLTSAALPCRASLAEAELTSSESLPAADLVVAGYVVGELAQASRIATVLRLWRAARQALLLVEPGTPDGFLRLRAARTALIAEGAHVAAPCTHANGCPMTGDAWCRFLARVQRTRDHKLLKGGERPFEDEPYAYLAVTRARPATLSTHRIVGRPAQSKAGVTLELCGAAGLASLAVASRDRENFKQMSRLRWGDATDTPGG